MLNQEGRCIRLYKSKYKKIPEVTELERQLYSNPELIIMEPEQKNSGYSLQVD